MDDIVIYMGRLRDDLETDISELKCLIKNNSWVYVFKHGYEFAGCKDSKTYEYQMINAGICLDISDFKVISVCKKI